MAQTEAKCGFWFLELVSEDLLLKFATEASVVKVSSTSSPTPIA
jgi:hypothetical protein